MATIQLSMAVRNARLAAYEATIGAAPILRMYSGELPPDCAATATGDLLVEMTLPADWLTAPAGGSVSMLGVWQAAALAAGKLGYYRKYETSGATCHEQGDITLTGGGGAMTVDNTDVAPTQMVTVTTFIRTDGNA